MSVTHMCTLQLSGYHRELHSFPTRRSSDLSTDVPRSRYADHPKQKAFFEAVVRNVRQIPGVLSAGYSSDLPLTTAGRSEEHTSELQSQSNLVCRLLLEKTKYHAYPPPTLAN